MVMIVNENGKALQFDMLKFVGMANSFVELGDALTEAGMASAGYVGDVISDAEKYQEEPIPLGVLIFIPGPLTTKDVLDQRKVFEQPTAGGSHK